MTITNYATLKTAVADFLNRDDLTSAIPTFIALAEAQMEREVRHYRMQQRSVADVDSRYTPVPPGWLETVRFHITDDRLTRLELTSLDDMLQLRQERGNRPGKPTHYAHVGSSLEIYPTPDTTYVAELLYYEKIPRLSGAVTTNWLLDAAPDAYLYGALLQSAPYLKDDARMQVWASLYSGAVAALDKSSDRAKYGGSGLRMRLRAF